ncbi:MAG: CPBP family intramembrane metalloprotease [Agathobacter sp.]|nr:CPBP family intramembrane metalloprotease [Agathobacter sp.]
MKKLYEKSEIWFAVAWIMAYCFLLSLGDNISASLGVTNVATFPIALLLSVVLYLFLKRNGLMESYGLCKSKVPAKGMLFYIPVLVMLTVNLMFGIGIYVSPMEAVFYVLTMFCVGFLEEVIFRGLLFNAMRKDGIKSAIIVSSLTFGMGHIINMFNGSGAELLPNLLQVVYATAAGFMFVMIYYKTESLLVCIAAHGVFNALSVFVNEAAITDTMRIFSCVFLIVVCGGYGIYITKTEFGNVKD